MSKKAETFILTFLEEAVCLNQQIDTLRKDLFDKASSRLIDFVDHIVIGNNPDFKSQLIECGFEVTLKALDYTIYSHKIACLPRVVINQDEGKLLAVAIKVESIDDFLAVRGLSISIEGSLLSAFRRCLINKENQVSLWVIERRGTQLIEPSHADEWHPTKYLKALLDWKTRPRSLDNEEEDMQLAITMANQLSAQFGTDMAACIVLEAERFYWLSRNDAGAIQKARQDSLGLGFTNNDHHAFRCSRKNFAKSIHLFEILGFHSRKRFHAGKQKTFGGQVLENTRAGFVIFLDYDLLEEEVDIDFSTSTLPPLASQNTIGLWCQLHGESIGRAGMHHLALQCSFDKLIKDLHQYGIEFMDPFGNFSYIKQAYTKGQIWQVEPKRLNDLYNESFITINQKELFEKEGAVGSHLGNVERKEDCK